VKTETGDEEKMMTTGKQLNVQNATVTTATIEVKTLTIGARQVTQGIFKQLIEEPLIAEDGTLNGVPWGHVNYCSDDCGSYHYRDSRPGVQRDWDRGHRHFIWQRGTTLYRCVVYSVDAESRGRLQHRRDVDSNRHVSFCAWDAYSDETRERHRQVRATLAQLPQLFIGG
jgi:hypothetical protein